MVSPRKSRRKSACFSITKTSTPWRARRKPNITPAGPPPAMQQRVWTVSTTQTSLKGDLHYATARLRLPGKFAVMPAIQIVDGQPDRQPGKESQPGQNGQTGHKQNAEEYAQHRRCNATRSTEPAMASGIAIAQNDHANRNQHEREERPNV